MAAITDKGMQAKATGANQWLTQPFNRGAGVFVGRITPSGERLFYFRYTDPQGGRPFFAIGPYHPKGQDGMTLAQAYDRATELSVVYRSGIKDLHGHFARLEEDRIRADETDRRVAADLEQAANLERERRISVRKLFDRWCSVDLQPHQRADGKRAGRKDGGQYAKEQFGRYVFPAIGDHAAVDVKKADVMAILDGVKAAGKLRTCNVLLADLKQMFAFALARDIIERNPLDTVSKRQAGGTDALRERVLTPDEIADLAGRLPLAGLSARSAAAILILLATGARIGELMGAAWTGVDLVALAALPEAAHVKVGTVDLMAGTWHLPTTKNERAHTIHLSALAAQQFRQLAELREVRTDQSGNSVPVPWIFPNTAGTGPVDVKSFGKQLADRQRPAELRMSGRSKNTEALMLAGGKWTAHDLRRTAGTVMASMGISGDVIDECLNHVIESRVRRTYIRDRRPQEQARAFDALGARLQELVSGQQAASNVIALATAA